ncbi:FimV/HubP family polar landmark protein [Bordetella sp. 15P40C-2]|uniref:FimV/HubP family polar landmark protein n=1 Tax=Bordetella sp. 15P40C-2 TaxID=2572246 RepID=UPI00132170CC|nr:FimV/HubP family polar landmark protein [Bordetella sp. 15P40C-2]MVW71244.1 peptidoglycan-binding protein LysM [Bordetella sp. 15P40C-2]
MNSPSRRYSHPYRIRAAYWAVALALGSFSGSLAQAATVGHARVVSAPGAPLQVVVPLADLTPEEQASLQISVPPAAAWQRAGVVPPVPVDSLRVRVLPGAQANRKTVRLESTQPIATSTVEVLLDVRSQSGSRQVQVTILVPQRASATPVQSARVGDVDPARGATAVTTTVRAGDNLFRIARRYEVPDANIIQMLVAIWRANPEVFIQNNMNLLRTGERLTIPDAATIRAVDPAQAQRIYLQHLEEFAQYRGRAGAQVASAAAVGNAGSADAGQVSATPTVEHKAAPVAQDRLKLSASNPTQAQDDIRTSGQHALQDARQRVETLEGNVQALTEAAQAQAQRENSGVSPTNVPGQGPTGASFAGAQGHGVTAGGPSQGADPNVAGQGGAAGAGHAGAGAGSGTVGGSAAGSDAARSNAGGSNADGAEAASSASRSSAAGALAAGSPGNGSTVTGSPATDSSGVGSSAAGSPMTGSSAAGTPATGSSDAGSAAGPSGTGGGSQAGSNAAHSTPGGVGTPGSYSAAGTTSPAGAASASSGDGLTVPGGPSRATTEAEAQDLAAAAGGAASQSNASTGNWLADNLLAIVTAGLALIVLIIAWMMRRAGARRADENEDAAYGEQVVDTAMLTRKLEGIDLNLDTPPSDETPPRNPRP